jgi:hypothetical protein
MSVRYDAGVSTAYGAAVKTTDSDKALNETVKALEKARAERRKAASAAKKKA